MTSYNGYSSTWTIEDRTINLRSSGLPYHSYGTGIGPLPTDQKNNITFKYRGGINSKGRPKSIGEGVIGYMLNGVALYSPSAGFNNPNGYPSPPSGYHYNRSYSQSLALGYSFNQDYAGGYTTSGMNGLGGIYHYQDSSFTTSWLTGIGATTGEPANAELSVIPYYNNTLLHPDGHSKIIGWSLDGYPIYGPYGYASPRNPMNGIRLLNSGYKLKNSSYRTGITIDLSKFPMGIFIEDYEFIRGDLDKHNGRYCITPDFPQGTYAYFATVDVNLNPVYPYLIGNTYYGDVQLIYKTPSSTTFQPLWQTPAGSLGSYVAETPVNLNLTALPIYPASKIAYSLLSGNLPIGLELTSNGVISGQPSIVDQDTTSNFTIRATDENGNFRDRSFYIVVPSQSYPAFTPSFSNLFSIKDSTWVEYQIGYTNTIPNNRVSIEVLQGRLPPGLEINDNGLIRGYALPPVAEDLISPITQTFEFSLILISGSGTSDIKEFSITVYNQTLVSPPNTRVPAILNNHPLTFNISKDIYYGYYTTGIDNFIGEVTSGDEFYFRVLGHDFDGQPLYYQFVDLPLGLIGNASTGWVTGTPAINSKGLSNYSFKVRVRKVGNPSIGSMYTTFNFTVNKDMLPQVSWVTPSNLGNIVNGSISDLQIIANSAESIVYKVIDGSLPSNLSLLETGEIVGRVPFQATTKIVEFGGNTKYTFTVEAFSPKFPLVSSKRTFTMTVVQGVDAPVETLYFKATPSMEDRKIIKSLLDDTSLIPESYLYRPTDSNFGKATNVKCAFAYGMHASSVADYLASIDKNFYWKNITLGEIKTAQARDENNNILYEVVYSQIIDDLVNSAGTTVSKKITWKTPISLQKGPWLVSNADIYTSWDFNNTYITSLTPEYIYDVFPNSLDNMEEQITSNIQQNNLNNLLPLWMTSQQENGSTLGFTKAWVIAYTLPGKALEVKRNIDTNWPHRLNQINFRLDRFSVDKSATYDWNTDLAIPAWAELPSSVPLPDPTDSKDVYVLFPRQTILPESDQS